MTQTQEMITFRVSKFMNGYEGMYMSGEKFLKDWQVKDKIIEWICSNSHSNIYEWLKLKT